MSSFLGPPLVEYLDSAEAVLRWIKFESDDGSFDDQQLAGLLFHRTEEVRDVFERWSGAKKGETA